MTSVEPGETPTADIESCDLAGDEVGLAELVGDAPVDLVVRLFQGSLFPPSIS